MAICGSSFVTVFNKNTLNIHMLYTAAQSSFVRRFSDSYFDLHYVGSQQEEVSTYEMCVCLNYCYLQYKINTLIWFTYTYTRYITKETAAIFMFSVSTIIHSIFISTIRYLQSFLSLYIGIS